MSKDDYRIWSNADLDYEEWKDWMEEEYPTLSEDERVNGIPFVPQKLRNFPAILEHRKIQANPL